MMSLSLTLVQCHLHWENPDANKHKIQLLLEPISHTDIIILPETFTTAFSMTANAEQMDGNTIAWMKRLSADKQALVVGSLIVEEKGHKYNRLICSLPNGEVHYYDKRHLFNLINESSYFTAGNKRLILEYKGWKLCPLICYDLRFPAFSRNHRDFDLLIYVANWPETRINHWTKLLEARAIENQCYVAGVNRIGLDNNEVLFNGQSRIVDANGNALYCAKNKEEAKTIELDLSNLISIRNKYPFLDDADDFTIL